MESDNDSNLEKEKQQITHQTTEMVAKKSAIIQQLW
jgi:hypothetical protein